jgi:thiol-disulfide isomerase/thioredoxin
VTLRLHARRRLLAGAAAIAAAAFAAPAAVLAAAAAATSKATAKFAEWKGGATPPLVLKDARGRTHDLASYKGRVVLVNFWATWCEPCLEEMPSLEDLQDRMKGKPFTLLTVNMQESEGRVKQFLQSTLLQEDSLVVLFDGFGTVAKDWKARMLPVSFLIGPDGRIRQSLLGAANWTAADVIAQIERLMPAARRG